MIFFVTLRQPKELAQLECDLVLVNSLCYADLNIDHLVTNTSLNAAYSLEVQVSSLIY